LPKLGGKIPGLNQLDDLLNKGKGLKAGENSGEIVTTLKGTGDPGYDAYLKMLDEAEKANKSGITAREFAKSKGIPSTLSDAEAAILEKYGVKMLYDGAGGGTPGAAGEGAQAGGNAGKNAGDVLQTAGDAAKEAAKNAEKIKPGKIEDLLDNVKNSYNGYLNNGWQGNYKGQTPGTNAGRRFDNDLGDLPEVNSSGDAITYREFDVNNRIAGTGRDGERFVVGSDGSIYYTNDHYASFTKIR
jgi:guanyl-specific ribonuclease Sa